MDGWLVVVVCAFLSGQSFVACCLFECMNGDIAVMERGSNWASKVVNFHLVITMPAPFFNSIPHTHTPSKFHYFQIQFIFCIFFFCVYSLMPLQQECVEIRAAHNRRTQTTTKKV